MPALVAGIHVCFLSAPRQARRGWPGRADEPGHDERGRPSQPRALRMHAAVIGEFLAVDRRDVRRVSVEIGPPDAEFLAVRIDPFPQALACAPPLRARLAVHADEIGCKPVAEAATQAAAMV